MTVEPYDAGLRIFDDAGTQRADWPRAGLRGDAMQEGGVLHVTHSASHQETLVIHDAELAARVRALCEDLQELPGCERKLVFAFGLLAGLLALMAGLYFATPAIARVVASRIPLAQERALGAQLEVVLDFSRCEDQEAEEALDALASKLAHSKQELYEVRLIENDEPNAFALPGGIVVVTSGLLNRAQSESEVAGVLAHVVQRHVLAGFLRGAALSAIWALAIGDYSGLLVIDPGSAYQLASLEFSRGDEDAADRGAVERLHRAGISHRGLSSFFERVKKEHGSGGPEWLSTHPSTDARFAKLRAVKDVAVARQVLSAEQFAAFKTACKASDAEDTNAPQPSGQDASVRDAN